jgi:hypothetical protein
MYCTLVGSLNVCFKSPAFPNDILLGVLAVYQISDHYTLKDKREKPTNEKERRADWGWEIEKCCILNSS